MRPMLVVSLLFAAGFVHAGVVNLPAQVGAPVNEDDWSIPLHRCLRSVDTGVGVYDGAERCAVEFALPLESGRRVRRVRALYADDDTVSQFRMHVVARSVVSGARLVLISGQDDDPAPATLESMLLLPNHVLHPHEAVSVLVEVQGDTRLLGLSYDYE